VAAVPIASQTRIKKIILGNWSIILVRKLTRKKKPDNNIY
jgi:hypothetical protein